MEMVVQAISDYREQAVRIFHEETDQAVGGESNTQDFGDSMRFRDADGAMSTAVDEHRDLR